VDEETVLPLMSGGEGWGINVIPGSAVGDVVKRNQPLATVYGRDYTTAQRTLLYALRASATPSNTAAPNESDDATTSLQEARLVLEKMGFAPDALSRLEQTRQIAVEVTLVSPAAGVVLARHLLPNQWFDRGAELFRIADLGRVWVTADLPVAAGPFVKPGERTTVLVEGARLDGAVLSVVPPFDPTSRTLKARVRVNNPDLVLRPGMYADVEFMLTLPEAISVPDEAVVDSGVHHTVFVERSDGSFEAREVETGWRFEGRVEILSGLNDGDSIAGSGTFLLHSALNLRAAP
jgi:RND family efflux transporter MFP subunit